MLVTVQNEALHLVRLPMTRAQLDAMDEEHQSDAVWDAVDRAGIRVVEACVTFIGVAIYQSPSEGLVWADNARGIDTGLLLDCCFLNEN